MPRPSWSTACGSATRRRRRATSPASSRTSASSTSIASRCCADRRRRSTAPTRSAGPSTSSPARAARSAAKGSWRSDRSATAASAARPAARSAAAAWPTRPAGCTGWCATASTATIARAPPVGRAVSAPSSTPRRASASASTDRTIASRSTRARPPAACRPPTSRTPRSSTRLRIPIEELERANAGQPFAFGNATFVPGRNDPDNDRASHFLTTAITLRRVESDRASWQASYQRVGTFRRYESGPLGPGFQTSTLSESEFDGSTDTFEARGHLQPASWLTVTAGYELEREHYGDLQDDNAVVAPLRTTTDDQPDRPRGVRRGAVLGPRSPAADRARRPAAGLQLRHARHRGDRRRSSVRRRRRRQPAARADRRRVGRLPGARRAARRCAAMSATRIGRPRSTSASAAGSSPIPRAARSSTRPTAIRGCVPTAIARSTPASTRRWPAAACRSRPRRSSSTCSR